MKVTKDNAVVGLKVTLDKDSQFRGQDRNAEYGEIIESSNCFPKNQDYLWVAIHWKDKDGKRIGQNYYQIGDNNKFDLNVYQEESKDVMPEYVECVGGYGNCVKGTVYCTANDIEANSLTWQEILISCGNLGSYFIPSTKEAYLQNQPKEDLVGRYLKTLVNNPVSIGMDIGEYLFVTRFNTDNATYDVTRVRDNHAGFGIEVSDLLKFEVMPIGFTPKSEVKPEVDDKYITNQWYHVISKSDPQCWIKYTNNSKGHGYSEWINCGVYQKKTDYIGSSNILEECSTVDIQKYLPTNHPDLIKTTNFEEFKVGDWVTIIANTNNSVNQVGDVGQITGDLKVTVKGRPDFSNSTRITDMRLATPEEIAKAQMLEKDEYISQAVEKLKVPYLKTSYKNFKECYTKLPIVTSVKRSNIVPLKLEKQKSLINLPTI
jgi:hypothetical protein